MKDYINFENSVIDDLINKPYLLQLYIFLSRRVYWLPKEKTIGNKRVIIPRGSTDIGRKQLARFLDANEKTVYSRLKNLEKLGYISIKNFSNITSIITVHKTSISSSIPIEVQQDISIDSDISQHTSNIEINKYRNKESCIQIRDRYKNLTLSEEEYINLNIQIADEAEFNYLLTALDSHKGSAGVSYKSDYYAILKWWNESKNSKGTNNKTRKGNDYGRKNSFIRKTSNPKTSNAELKRDVSYYDKFFE